ncbi:MAG: LysR family transcriptional regulator [Salinisphaeraceae bacterium]|nr:LysR family transcriptional regulator [Salinisphaeraceae bacterium]
MQLTQIEIRRLRYFVAVAEQRSFRAAALHLHISQPPLTRQIQQLEAVLEVTLFERLPRGVELTEAGRVFYVEARNILDLTQQAVDRVRLAGEGRLGRLDVGTFGSAVLSTVPTIMLAFRRGYPRVEITLHNMRRDEQLKALRERRLTVGFNRFFEDEPGLTWEVVKREKLMLAVHEDHPLARTESVSLKALAGEQFIAFPHANPGSPGFSERARAILAEFNVEPAGILEVDDVTSAASLVSGGFGLSLVTESSAVLQLPGVVYRRFEESGEFRFDLAMIYRSDDDSSLLRAFIEAVRSIRGEHGWVRAGGAADTRPLSTN